MILGTEMTVKFIRAVNAIAVSGPLVLAGSLFDVGDGSHYLSINRTARHKLMPQLTLRHQDPILLRDQPTYRSVRLHHYRRARPRTY